MGLDYSDVRLKPTYSDILSRNECDTRVTLGPISFKSPLIPANMQCCINFDLAKQLAKDHYFYILHRYYNYDQIYDFIKSNQNIFVLSISVGVNKKDYHLIDRISKNNLMVDYITIDIAHGHSLKMKNMIAHIKTKLPNTFVIAGNICTQFAVENLYMWGADCAKVGLSCGAGCSTYNCTGIGSYMFSNILECTDIDLVFKLPVIADGGIREPADVCKALVAGAKMVMAGSIFAASIESPAICYDNVTGWMAKDEMYATHKKYYGSASKENGNERYIEGKSILLDINQESYFNIINRYNAGIRSCMSYGGIRHISQMSTIDWETKGV
jgi:GMP reductase